LRAATILVNAGPDFWPSTENLQNELWHSAKELDVDRCKFLVDLVRAGKTDLNISKPDADHDYDTALHMVYQNYDVANPRSAEMVKLLIDGGAEVDAQNQWGRTPLSGRDGNKNGE